MTEKYIDLRDTIIDANDTARDFMCSCYDRGVEAALEYFDTHPDQVPRPRMTYSELAEEVKSVERVEKRFEAVAYVLTNLGFTICSDPKPTNAERWQELLAQYKDEATGLESFGDWADRKGLRAPEADDD